MDFDFLIHDAFAGPTFTLVSPAGRTWFLNHVAAWSPMQENNDGSIWFEPHIANMILMMILAHGGFSVQIDGCSKRVRDLSPNRKHK